jgi:hypothetical protein
MDSSRIYVETYDNLSSMQTVGFPSDALLLLDLLHTSQEKQAFITNFRKYNLPTLTFNSRDNSIEDLEAPDWFLDLLLYDVQPSHRVAFKKVVFQVFGRFLVSDHIPRSVEEPWKSPSESTTWDQFRILHRIFETWGSCTSDMTEATLKSILDWTTILVGPRLLKTLSSQLSLTFDPLASSYLKKQCLNIIRDLEELENGDLLERWIPDETVWLLNLVKLKNAIMCGTSSKFRYLSRALWTHPD